MTAALIEDPRTTLYRQRLADLLRRPSCQWISFSIGTAPIHRSFFESVAVAVEGLPTGEVRRQNSISHRQVQYGVRLRIAASDSDHASYDADRDVLIVPAEGVFGTLDGQASLLGACVHLGLDLEGRNYHWYDSECAARIALHLYRLYETVAVDESEVKLTEKLQGLVPTSPAEKPFFDAATDIMRHCRATLRANRRSCQLQPGSFMSIVRTGRCRRLHNLLMKDDPSYDRPRRRPMLGILPRASRFLALQAIRPAAIQA